MKPRRRHDWRVPVRWHLHARQCARCGFAEAYDDDRPVGFCSTPNRKPLPELKDQPRLHGNLRHGIHVGEVPPAPRKKQKRGGDRWQGRSRSAQAVRLVTERGVTPSEAARRTGLGRSAVSEAMKRHKAKAKQHGS